MFGGISFDIGLYHLAQKRGADRNTVIVDAVKLRIGNSYSAAAVSGNIAYNNANIRNIHGGNESDGFKISIIVKLLVKVRSKLHAVFYL